MKKVYSKHGKHDGTNILNMLFTVRIFMAIFSLKLVACEFPDAVIGGMPQGHLSPKRDGTGCGVCNFVQHEYVVLLVLCEKTEDVHSTQMYSF